jgi:DNA-binding NarL/FixJ family response regulator
VLELLLLGLVEKQIALQLGISRHTVHGHVRELYGRLGLHDRTSLVLLAREALVGGGPT